MNLIALWATFDKIFFLIFSKNAQISWAIPPLIIGQDALSFWLKHLFETYPKIQHIGFTTWSGNQGMMRLGEKSGLKLEGQIRKVRYWQETWYDSIKYGILREELKK